MMDFYELVDQVANLFQQRGKLSYRSLRYQYKLDDEALDALKEELLYAHPQVVDDDGRGFLFTGESITSAESIPPSASTVRLPSPLAPQPVQAEPLPTEPPTPDAVFSETFESYNPFTAQPWVLIPRAGGADVDRAVEAAHRAFSEGVWPRLLPTQRGALLRKLGDLLTEHAHGGAGQRRDSAKTIAAHSSAVRDV